MNCHLSWKHSFCSSVDHDNNNPLLIKYGVTNSVGWRMYSLNTPTARRTVDGHRPGECICGPWSRPVRPDTDSICCQEVELPTSR